MEDRLQINPVLVVGFLKKQVWVKLFGIHALTASLLFIFFILNSISVPAQPVDHLVLHQGTLKLLREGRSHLLWKPGLKLRLMKGDRLHTGSGARVSLKFMQESENIELFSHTFFAVEGIAEEQRNMALLVGKGNFALPPAPQQAIEETPEKKVIQASEEIEQEKSTNILSEAKEPQKEEVRETSKTTDTALQTEKAKTDSDKKGLTSRTQKKIARTSKLKRGGLLARKKRFKVRTVSAVVGVRGTEFVVAAAEDSTNVMTLTGEVTLASTELPEYEITLPKSSVSKVTEGRTPSQPVSVPILEQQQIVDSASIEGFQEVEFGPTQAVEAIQEGEGFQPTGEVDLGTGEEVNILEQLETLDSVQQVVDSAEEAINLSQTRMLILKTNIIPR
tara:strand:+ start:350 stop:1522 length:1173 start_codon:yes stop_codon:yes gene_type:complete